jgi:lipoprotein-anchoring transpeptidase ErfK/SrfK
MSVTDKRIVVDISKQALTLMQGETVLQEYVVSTARNGAGERYGSECTPRGQHIIRAKIGAHEPINTVFIGRRPTGEIYNSELRRNYPERDWILTRILWLSGCEPGQNRLGEVDTMRRYIYIHGCPDDDSIGVPGSHGCIKMRNSDIVMLFDDVETGLPVYIHE